MAMGNAVSDDGSAAGPRFDEGRLGVARIYAEALLGLAEERGVADELLGELAGLAEVLAADARAIAFLSSPLVGRETRRRALERAFRGRASDLLADALQVIQRKGRLDLLPEIVESFRREHDRRRDRVDVAVRTAVPLTEEARLALERAIARSTGKTPRLRSTVDPDLLGGLVVRVGDRKFDSSLSSQLGRLEAALAERASSEVIRRRREDEPGANA